MPMTIALAGKGGTGKTTVAALLTKYLIEQNVGSVLAIDADPSANLNLALGMPLDETIGDIREGMLDQVGPGGAIGANSGMSKADYLEYEIEYALVEDEHVDLLAMGRPEGQGCYCPVNHLLREIIDRLGRSYDVVIIDNEAGMEHLSRRTTRDVDVLLIVTDPSMRGVVAAGHIAELSRDLEINVAQAHLVVNRVQNLESIGMKNGLPPALHEKIEEFDIPLAGTIPNAPEIMALDAEGRPLVELEESSEIYRAIQEIAHMTLPVFSRQ
ncbi:MAG: Septum site-determining protein MinD [Anaerolineales bacterium]|nr:Septum site-determining protein MinD [Anaerolineales bacterium]